MSEAQMLAYAIAVIGVLITALAGITVWAALQIRSDVKMELSELSAEVRGINNTLGKIERDLRGELVNLDRRMTKIEVRDSILHMVPQDHDKG